MAENRQRAYCFHRAFEPAAARRVVFDRHYLLYSAQGTMHLEGEDRNWVLLPTCAAFIPAGTPITVAMHNPAVCCSVLFHPDFVTPPINRSAVFAVTPVLREMIWHSRRWGPDPVREDPVANAFFKALALTAFELTQQAGNNLWLPPGQSHYVRRALAVTGERFAEEMEFPEVALAASLSERALARRIITETGLTWRQIRRRMRMIRAMELLGEPARNVSEVALDVGYQSFSAFSRAFTEFAGQTPSDYRRCFAQATGNMPLPP